MKVILAKSAGFCYGVERAVALARETAKDGNCAMMGEIIHNDAVIGELNALGMRCIKNAQQAQSGERVLLRSHGERRETVEALRERGAQVVDAACPNVLHIRKLIMQAEQEGRQVLLIGEAEHPELLGFASRCAHALVFGSAEEVENWTQSSAFSVDMPISVAAQTTCIRALFESCVKILKKQCTNLKIHDTICNATQRRQQEAAQIAASADVMVVAGDRKSANTRHLTEICRGLCPRVYQIENAAELQSDWFTGCRVAGLTAGASTPAGIIKEVVTTMTEEIKTTEGTESFEELLEKSFKTLNMGEKVTGVVTAVSPTEVQLDVGAKQAAYIKASELSDDPNAKPEDIVKVGDEIEAYIYRVSDVDGVAELSKKRLDAVKVWENIENAVEAKTTLEGTVTGVNKGGLEVSVKGVRVFVPASQSGMPKDADLSAMIKEKVQLRVTEVNRARRRVVGSIRAVANEARQAAQAAIWENIEIGKRYTGTVKSMTSYGVFVDIGGVDGMVHISELSWSRIKNPAEIVKVGDTLEVYVINFDADKRKISLGVKDKTQNPWDVFMNTCAVGDVKPVRIVKLMTFGAFAEVVPGVDGLIHISQIADRRIDKPADVLAEGDIVNAKIIGIDEEKKKVSLSIRALLAPAAQEEAPVEE